MAETTLTTGLSYSKNETMLTVGSKYSGSQIYTSNYSSSVATVDASKYSKGINITNSYSKNVVIKGGAGKDTLTGGSSSDKLIGGAGNDVLYGGYGNDTLDGGAGNDSLLGQNGYNVLIGGAGNDTLNGGSGYNSTLTGGAGKDVFFYEPASGNYIITDYTAGQDTIQLGYGVSVTGSSSSSYTVKGKTIKDIILRTSNNGSIRIVNGGGKAITVSDYYKRTTSLIYGYNEATLVVGDSDVNANGYITNYPSTTGVSIGAIDGSKLKKKKLSSSYSVRIINGGASDDYITASDSAGQDRVLTAHTVNGGAGNDIINGANRSSDLLIGGAGNDTLYFGSNNGNYKTYDTLTGSAGKDVFYFSAVSGSSTNVITDMEFGSAKTGKMVTGNDTIYIPYGSHFSYYISGKDVIFNNLSYYSSSSSSSLRVLNGLNQYITVTDRYGTTTMRYSDPYTLIIDNTYQQTIDASSSSSDYTNILTFDASFDKLSSRTSKPIHIIGNSRSNTIRGSKLNDVLEGKSGSDSISALAGDDTLIGGIGYDTLNGGEGKDVFIYESGNDVIMDYTAGQDKIYFSDTTLAVVGSAWNSDDMILTIGRSSLSTVGTITLKDYKSKKITAKANYRKVTMLYSDGYETTQMFGAGESTLFANNAFDESIEIPSYRNTSLVRTIDASNCGKKYGKYINLSKNYNNQLSSNYIISGKGNDTLVGDIGNDVLNGGEGNDTINGNTGDNTLTGGKGNDVFIYGNGNDVIVDYAESQDLIDIKNQTITGSRFSGTSVILTTSNNGTITINNARGSKTIKKITISSNGEKTKQVYGTSMSTLIVDNNDSNNIDLDNLNNVDLVKYVDASTRTKSVNIVGNDNGIRIKGSNKIDTLTGGTGNDSLYGEAGNDILTGGAGDDILNGGAGNDTLNGGTGNNTLTGGKGNDVFVYTGGEDVITDYAKGDVIKSVIGVTSWELDDKDVIFNLGNGSITVKNGKNKEITVNNHTQKYNASTANSYISSENNVVEDVWFMANDDIAINNFDSNLESIITTKDVDYSVDQIKTSDILQKSLSNLTYNKSDTVSKIKINDK